MLLIGILRSFQYYLYVEIIRYGTVVLNYKWAEVNIRVIDYYLHLLSARVLHDLQKI